MACTIDPRMMDLVWTERFEYESLLHKRPVCTQAQPTNTPAPKTYAAAAAAAPVATAAPAAAPVAATVAPTTTSTVAMEGKSLLADLEAARGFIRASLDSKSSATTVETLQARATQLETSNANLNKLVADLTKQIERIESKVGTSGVPIPAAPVAAPAAKKEESDDNDFDMFSDDDEVDAKPKETMAQRLKRECAEKKCAEDAEKLKSKKSLKSNVILDIKPWDDETDMAEMEKAVRAIKMDGLLWGSCQLIEIGYGIHKLRMSTCIVDELVGLYDLEDNICALEDYVQSVDTVSHNKI